MEQGIAKHRLRWQKQLKFIEFLNMSRYSNTRCVIHDPQHKRRPLFVRNTDASFIRGK